ncbi:MAG: hypothetical protein JJ902_03970 [Roseibium sp.]|nr:hypothetical protein [Roseibium sp.]
MAWTDFSKTERMDLIKHAINSKMSATDFAETVGTTRGAVLGFCYRNKIRYATGLRKALMRPTPDIEIGQSAEIVDCPTHPAAVGQMHRWAKHTGHRFKTVKVADGRFFAVRIA